MPRDAVSRTANVERTGRHKWVNHSIRIRFVSAYYLHEKANMQPCVAFVKQVIACISSDEITWKKVTTYPKTGIDA